MKKPQDARIAPVIKSLKREAIDFIRSNNGRMHAEIDAWIDGIACACNIVDRTFNLGNAALEELQAFFYTEEGTTRKSKDMESLLQNEGESK